MIRLSVLFSLALALTLPAVTRGDDQKGAEKPAEGKSIKVKAGDLQLTVPERWKKRAPKNELRLAEYEVPAGDLAKEAGEFVVFYFGRGQGGDLDGNITRWVGQLEPEGRSVKLLKGECSLGEYTLVDVTGTYNKSIGPPVLRKSQKLTGWRVINVYLQNPGGPYFLKIDGPEKVVAKELDALRASFGGDAKTEKEVEFKAK
jgi:hypothetical protein